MSRKYIFLLGYNPATTNSGKATDNWKVKAFNSINPRRIRSFITGKGSSARWVQYSNNRVETQARTSRNTLVYFTIDNTTQSEESCIEPRV